jgi:DNA-binding beta-propeller fold protein YncE
MTTRKPVAIATLFIAVAFTVSEMSAAEVVTLAGTGKSAWSGDGGPAIAAAVGEPYGVEIGPDGALYVCEIASHVIRRIDMETGIISTVAGCGEQGYSGDGGDAKQARLNEPYEIRFDRGGNLIFVEMKNAIVRRVDATTGIITTIAGTGQEGFAGDGGPATLAQMKQPHSIALDAADHLYICDIGNHRIRRVDAETGIISTFAGTGSREPTPDGAAIAGTPLNGPRALHYDGRGTMALALREGNSLYRIELAAGLLRHVGGTGRKGYTGDGGDAKLATLSGPKGVAVSPAGDIYFADTESHTVRVVRSATGIIETVVGDGQRGDGPDGDPSKCRLARPHGVCVDAAGNVYIGDSEAFRVRVLKVD